MTQEEHEHDCPWRAAFPPPPPKPEHARIEHADPRSEPSGWTVLVRNGEGEERRAQVSMDGRILDVWNPEGPSS